MTRHEFEKALKKHHMRSLRQEYNQERRFHMRHAGSFMDFRKWILNDKKRTTRYLLERKLIRHRRLLELPIELFFHHKKIKALEKEYELYRNLRDAN